MKAEELPESREEFEARAILFYILMQLKNLLEAKKGICRGEARLKYFKINY